jgi:biofilm PGA synthesis N-glycosyltransferase PgaC
MDILFSVLFVLYFLLVVGLIIGWRRALNMQRPEPRVVENYLSVIIPVRNEQSVVAFLIEDLRGQTYESFEVIFVDDHSDDETYAIVEALSREEEHFKIIRSAGKGKKHALSSGVALAKGNVIVTTDADCRIGPEWLTGVNQYFQNEDIKMAFGGVRIMEDDSFFSNLQAIEFSSLIGSGAAVQTLGLPAMCNGANLAIRKKILDEVGGYEDNIHIPSGDDEFLLRKVHAKYPHGIRFMATSETIVVTMPLPDLDEFIHQRIRWAGKWRHNDHVYAKALALAILFFQITFLLMIPLAFAGVISAEVCLLLMAGKFAFEFFFLSQVTRFLETKWSWGAFILLQFLYPVYVVFIGIGSHFQGFVWKGRKLKSIQTNVRAIADND